MREQGWWPQLRHYVSMITATKAVGPTHGLTVYINTKHSDFMGHVPGGQDRATSALSRSLGVMVRVAPPMPAGLVANFISLATALGASFTDQEYKARESIWVGRKQRTGLGGGTNDKPRAIRSLAQSHLPQWRMPLDLNAWPKPVEAFVIGHLYEGFMMMYFRDITCLTNHSTVHFRSGIPHSSLTAGQATVSCRRNPDTEKWNGVSPSTQTHRQWDSQ